MKTNYLNQLNRAAFVLVVPLTFYACSSETEPVAQGETAALIASDGGYTPIAARSCGGFVGARCKQTEYCDFTPNSCGYADASGVCRPRPDVCTHIYAPVCGCDGKTYSNACQAAASETDVSRSGTCEPRPPTDCRKTGCTPKGYRCEFCWTSWQCLPPNVQC